MEVRKINSFNTVAPALKKSSVSEPKYYEPSFKSNISNEAAKKGWLFLRRLGSEMKNITEIKNAFIAAIGTGIIAPIIILVSPGKGDKQDKDKKFLQALRQPLSALLQLFFQVPATMGINRGIDKLAYKRKLNFFKDDVIGDLIPTEKYLARSVKKEEIQALERRFDEVVNGKSLRQELEEKIKVDYKEVGLEISDEDLAKRVEKKKKNFLTEKIARGKSEAIKNAKIQEIMANIANHPIEDIDLVTESYQELAKHRLKTEYMQLEKDAGLSVFDKTLRLMGLETKKVKLLKEQQEAFGKREGLKILKQEKPEIFENTFLKVKNYIEAYEKKATENFNGKKFWISLLVNLVMVTISCFTLNWIHPKVNKWIEERRAEKAAENNQKAEVK